MMANRGRLNTKGKTMINRGIVDIHTIQRYGSGMYFMRKAQGSELGLSIQCYGSNFPINIRKRMPSCEVEEIAKSDLGRNENEP